MAFIHIKLNENNVSDLISKKVWLSFVLPQCFLNIPKVNKDNRDIESTGLKKGQKNQDGTLPSVQQFRYKNTVVNKQDTALSILLRYNAEYGAENGHRTSSLLWYNTCRIDTDNNANHKQHFPTSDTEY